jgi:F0F1-type ATP synthase membrane subunit c/vacuolar-type H+-ATPase subunit K
MNLFIFIAETQPIFGGSQSSASREQYKMNLFIFIAETQPIFGESQR